MENKDVKLRKKVYSIAIILLLPIPVINLFYILSYRFTISALMLITIAVYLIYFLRNKLAKSMKNNW